MLICLCNGISERKIRQLAREGASSWREVARGCGAGASCGGCRRAVDGLIREVRSELEAVEPTSASAFADDSIAPSPA